MRYLAFVLVGVFGASALLAQGRGSAQPQTPQTPQVPLSGPGPSRQPQEPLTYEGLIIGRVIDASTGRPLAGAAVTINGGMQPPMAPVPPGAPRPIPTQPPRYLTDADGRFAFRNLTRGSYNLSAEKSGYAYGQHGQSRPEGPSRSLQLADRERRGDVTIRLFKYATISGTIVDDIGEPVVAARVRVLRRTLVSGRRMLQQGQMTQTDDRGQYRLAGLMPGEYVVSVPQMSSSLPSDFALSGPMPANLSITLSTPGSLGFSLSPGSGPLTADGRFRLSTAGPSPFITVPGASGVMAYGTQYYPNAAVVSQAQLVVVGSGEDRSGVDLVLRLRPTASVAGMLMGPDGPAVNFALHLVPSDGGEMSADPSVATAVTDMNGAFAFLAVPSGQYVIQTVRVPRPTAPPMALQSYSQSFTSVGPGGAPITGTMTMGVSGAPGIGGGLSPSGPPPPAVPAEPTLWVATPISVGDTDIGGLALSLREGLSVSGQVEFDGAAERPPAQRLSQISATLQPADGKQRSGSQPGRVDANGRFTIPQVIPGLYRLNVGGGIGAWTLRSAMLNGVDVLDVPLALDSKNIANIVVTFTDRPSSLGGTVRMPVSAADGAPGQKNPDVALIVFPADPQLMNAGFSPRRTRMIRAAPVGGGFGFGNLPPGDYYAIAIPDEVSGEWQDPKFLEQLARSATRVTIGEGERKMIDLAIEDIRPPGREPAPASAQSRTIRPAVEAAPITASRVSAPRAGTVTGDDERERGPFVDERERDPFVDEREQAAPQARDARIDERVGSGSISGVVLLDDPTPRPVRHARVSVSGGAGASRTVLTDGDGRFRVDLLPAARYSINATKPAYLTAYQGSTRPGRGPGTPIMLTAGESRTGITLRMARGAVITGTITDEFGAPLQGLSVRVMQPIMRDGERTWLSVGIPSGGPNASDDRGVYRVYGLPPGNYALSVMPTNMGNMAETRQLSEGEMRAAIAALTAPVAIPQEAPGSGLANLPTGLPGRGGLPGRAGLPTGRTTGPSSAAPPPPPAQPLQPAPSFPPVGRAVGYSPVFYPGTALEHEATLVSVGIGQELTGIDLPMRLIPTAKIEGSVLTPDGRPAERVNVQVTSSVGTTSSSTGVRMTQDGKFMTGSLAPGKYMLTVRVMGPPPPPPPPPGPGNPAGAVPGPVPMSSMNPALWAQQEVVVNGEDITGVALTLAEGTTITGRVVFQGTLPQPDPTRVRITAEPVGANRVLMGLRSAPMDASGAFELTGVTPGRYRLSATASIAQPMASATAPPPPTWALRSSLVAGRDTLDMPIEIGPGQDVRGAVLTFTDKPAELSGAILDAARNGIPDLTVALFATEPALWTMNPRRLRSLRSTADGSFRFIQMPPGEYYLAVISELDQSSWGDPAFMEQVAAAAIRVTIGEGEKKVQDIQIR